jgi:hypothetical protein
MGNFERVSQRMPEEHKKPHGASANAGAVPVHLTTVLHCSQVVNNGSNIVQKSGPVKTRDAMTALKFQHRPRP